MNTGDKSPVLVVSGDPSGDLHASNLIKALKKRDPELRVAAIGGPLSKAVADEFIEDLVSRGLTGFWEPLIQLPFFFRLAGRIKAFFKDRRPAAVVCVDYYGFNRRVLGWAKAAAVPAFYFVSPQVWATRPGRVMVLKSLVRRMFVIFPFEEKLYRDSGVPADFVGHPLLDLIPPPPARRARFQTSIVGLLPGSRSSELRRHLPLFYETFKLLKASNPSVKGLLFAAPGQPDSAYGTLPEGVELVRDHAYALRGRLDAALCSSGTATLENALLGVPMVVVYKLSWLTYWIARMLIRVPYIAMANLLAEAPVVPELIQSDAEPARAAAELARFIDDEGYWARTREALLDVRRRLGEPGACDRAAALLMKESSA